MGTKTFLSYTNDLLLPFGETAISSSDWMTLKGPQAVAKYAILRAVDVIMSRERKWPFNAQPGSQVLTVGVNEYSWPSGFRDVDMKSFYIQKDDSLSVGTKNLKEISKEYWYSIFRDWDFDNTTNGLSVPTHVFRTAGGFGITPVPDQAYTVKYTYYDIPTRMSAYNDTTTVPDEFQHVVIDNAIPYTNYFYENDEQMRDSKDQAKESLGAMRSTLINDDFRMEDTRTGDINRG